MSFETEIVEALSKGDPMKRVHNALDVCRAHGLMGNEPEPGLTAVPVPEPDPHFEPEDPVFDEAS